MSYQLVFWDRSAKLAREPRDIYKCVLRGLEVEGLPEVPWDSVNRRLTSSLVGWTQSESDPLSWGRNDDPSYGWNMSLSPNGVVFTFYGVDAKTINAVIDAMYDLGMGCYDPQVGQFFDGREA